MISQEWTPERLGEKVRARLNGCYAPDPFGEEEDFIVDAEVVGIYHGKGHTLIYVTRDEPMEGLPAGWEYEVSPKDINPPVSET